MRCVSGRWRLGEHPQAVRDVVVEDVDELTADDHVGCGEVFERLALGGIRSVDAAVDPDAEEYLGLHRLDRAADVRAGVFLPAMAST